MSKYKFALATTSVRAFQLQVRRGEAWHADHPLVVANPDLFGDDPPDVLPRRWEPEVEQATAAPGEKRTSRRG
jgi:hypothetical protein